MIIWSPLLGEVFGNICIAIVCEPAFDVINFEIRERNSNRGFCGLVSRNLVALSCDNIIGKYMSRMLVKVYLFVEIVIKMNFIQKILVTFKFDRKICAASFVEQLFSWSS